MSKRLFPPPPSETPLPARVPFRPTHVLRAPKPDAKAGYHEPRVMELSFSDNRIVEAFVRAGWEVLEVIEK